MVWRIWIPHVDGKRGVMRPLQKQRLPRQTRTQLKATKSVRDTAVVLFVSLILSDTFIVTARNGVDEVDEDLRLMGIKA